jgi:predicted esterase
VKVQVLVGVLLCLMNIISAFSSLPRVPPSCCCCSRVFSHNRNAPIKSSLAQSRLAGSQRLQSHQSILVNSLQPHQSRLSGNRRNTMLTRTFLSSIASNSGDNDEKSKTVSTENETIINVLCLHGKGNNGKSFQKILAPFEEQLRKKTSPPLNFQFDYLDAPFPMEDNKHDKLQWWTLPPGVRSFNAKEYKGFEQSSKLVEEALRHKDYHFILGHSQGAILLSALIACDSWTKTVFGEKQKHHPIGYILNGCAWPNPYKNQLESYQYSSSNDTNITVGNSHKPTIFFIIGEKDNVNPPEGAELVRNALMKGGLEAKSCYHAGGHAVPVKDEKAVEEMVHWIAEQAAVITQ